MGKYSIPKPPQPPFAIYDPRNKCWIGNDDGVKTYNDWELTRLAATVATEQVGRLMLPRPYDGEAKKFKDEIPLRFTPLQALVRLEGRTG